MPSGTTASRFLDGSAQSPRTSPVCVQVRGIDAYFGNTSGAVSDAVLPLINVRTRIAVCGTGIEAAPDAIGGLYRKRVIRLT